MTALSLCIASNQNYTDVSDELIESYNKFETVLRCALLRASTDARFSRTSPMINILAPATAECPSPMRTAIYKTAAAAMVPSAASERVVIRWLPISRPFFASSKTIGTWGGLGMDRPMQLRASWMECSTLTTNARIAR